MYQSKCTKSRCKVKLGDVDPKTGRKILFWAYTDAKTGKSEGRCAKHLGK